MFYLSESISCWENIKQTARNGKPIALYGTGNGADKIIDFCEKHNIRLAGIFVSDKFCREQVFRGYKVETYKEIVQKIGKDFLLIIAFASELPEVLQRFQDLSKAHTTLVPHLGLYKDENLDEDWFAKHQEELQYAYDNLADDWSKKVFLDMLNYKFSGKIHYLFDHVTQRQDDLQLLDLKQDEIYYDLGAYTGDTAEEVPAKARVLVEADYKNFGKLQNNLPKSDNNILINAAIWKEEGHIQFSSQSGRAASIYGAKSSTITCTTIDKIVEKTKLIPTYIKMDLEGAEKEALAGGTNAIQQYKPKMLIAGYHFNEDLFAIPLAILQLNPNYQIYLRKHPYVPDWEINFFVK
ncbi:MAG: FkbM family methyltransferase [Acidaminococcaceae bacterium]|nr:FkbM family methyltransferase [Acidaminococcaceae bacterium]